MADDARDGPSLREDLPLSRAAEFLLNECRMVLPGMQALFGFQLIAVFNANFSQVLGRADRLLHLFAIVLIVLAIALIMTPAAYHRQTTPQEVTQAFIRLSTRLMLWSMLPLCVSISLDFYLIAKIILGAVLAVLLASALFTVFLILWFILPRIRTWGRTVSAPT